MIHPKGVVVVVVVVVVLVLAVLVDVVLVEVGVEPGCSTEITTVVPIFTWVPAR